MEDRHNTLLPRIEERESTLPLLEERESTRLLKVGELARRAGRTVRALRFYEETGLLAPVGRTEGGFRLYAPEGERRVMWIDKLQALGFSLHEIRAFLRDFEASATAPEAMARVRAIFRDRLEETHAQIARLTALRAELEESLAYLEDCHRCTEPTDHTACVGCHRCGHDGAAPALVAGLHLS